MKNEFLAPRQFKIVIYQLFGSLLLLFSILMIIPTVVSFIHWAPKDILIGSLLSIPPFLLGVSILYASEKYIDRVIFNEKIDVLIIRKKGQKEEIYELQKISGFILKELMHPMPGFKKFEIDAESDDGSFTTLFSDDIVVFGRRWIRFCDKLARVSDKPMKRKSMIENLSGKFSSKRESTD